MKGEVENTAKRDSNRNEKPDKIASQFNEEHFRQIYFYDSPQQESFSSRLKNFSCNTQWFFQLFPIFKWLPNYNIKNLSDDVISGLTVAVMHIPQGMAYALLGGVPPIVGIYMAFFPVIIYIIMGTSRHVSMGTFAVVSMMVGKSVDAYSQPLLTNSTETIRESHYSPTEIATAVCFIVGIWQVILSILRLGSLSVLLSQTLVSGFTTGAAVHVLTSQIRNLLGIKVKRYAGPFKIVYSYIDIFKNISNLNILATILSVSFISILVMFNEMIKPYLQRKFKKTIPIPVELLVVIIGTLLSQYLNMKETFGLAIVDNIPTGLPEPQLPPFSLLSNLLVDGLIIAIVAISINLSMASIFAQKLGYEIDANQEILASGAGNVFASFFSCMPYAASLSRSLIQQSVGGQTQIASVVSCTTLIFVLLFIGPFFEPLPYCVLSTIIVVALKGMLKQLGELPGILRNSILDGLVWIAAFLGVVLLDIDYGLGIGLMTSLMTLLIHGQNVKVLVLGHIPNTTLYVEASRYQKFSSPPKMLILQIIGGLHFANAAEAKKKILKLFSAFTKRLSGNFMHSEKETKCLSLIIDFSCVPFLDPSAIKCFGSLYEEVRDSGSNIMFCGSVSSVYDSLDKSPHFSNVPKSIIFHNVHDAVEFASLFESKYSSEVMSEFISKF